VPGALRDYDIPDLTRGIAPRKQLWVDPVSALAEPLEQAKAAGIIGMHEGLQVVNTPSASPSDVCGAIESFLR